MKRTYLALILVYSICTLSYAQYSGDEVFDDSYIHEIHITSELSKTELFTNYLNEWGVLDYSYSVSSVLFDGVLLDSVGVRIKGGVSAYDPKKPFKLDFSQFKSSQKYDGLKKINLHQGNMDPTYMKEIISYNILRYGGVKTVRTSYSKVFFNGEYQGIYTIVEQVNRDFIHERFASNEGALYKTGASYLDLKFEKDSSLRYMDFIDKIKDTPNSQFADTLRKYLDVESFVRFFATEVFVQALDGPLKSDNNYYLYFEPKSTKYVYIPWDYNLSFYGTANHTILQSSFNLIFQKLKLNEDLREQYINSFCQLLQYNFDENRIHQLLEANRLLIENEVINDPYSDQLGDFESSVSYFKGIVTDRISLLTAEMNNDFAPCSSLESPVNALDLVINEIVASNDLNSGIVDPNGGFADWIELYNNSSSNISLDGFYLSNDEDFLKHWRFPQDQIIEANSYLIIWADRDIDEEGLHVDFKLNKDKGDLFLSYEDELIIDALQYEMQNTNIALVRFPNGTGSFIEQEATFNQSNDGIVSITDDLNSALRISPNPIAGNTNLSLHSSKIGDYYLHVVDITGKVLKQEEICLEIGQNRISNPLNNLSSGMYSIILTEKISKTKHQFSLIRLE